MYTMSTCDSDQEDTLRRLLTNIPTMTKMEKNKSQILL